MLDNIEEHSRAKNVYLFAQYWKKLNACEVCIIDDGVGIFESLKKARRDIKDHMDALKQVLETGLSSKTEFGDIKRGTGIRNTRLAITNKDIHGEFLIITGNAAFMHSATEGARFYHHLNSIYTIMLDKVINLATIFESSSLILRQTAKELADIILKSKENNIILDFTNINYASRSFFDELNGAMQTFKKANKIIDFINMNENIENLFKMVLATSKNKSDFTYISLADVDTVSI